MYGDVVAELNASNAVTASYVLGGSGIISQTRSGTTSYFLSDVQGSTRALTTGGTPTITQSYNYDSFGELLAAPPTLNTSYLYTGQQFDSSTGLYSLRARYYDAAVGRFLSRDTWAIDRQNPRELNRYVYTSNNPLRYSDPSGHQSMGEVLQLTSANFGGGGKFPRMAFGAVAGAMTGAVIGAITANIRYGLMRNGACGQRLQDFTDEVPLGVYMQMSMAAGAAGGAFFGAAAAGGVPPVLLARAGAVIAAVGLIPTAVDLVFGGNSQAWCNAFDLIIAIGSLLIGYGGANAGSGGAVANGDGTLSIVGNIIAAAIDGSLSAALFDGSPGSGGENEDDSDGGNVGGTGRQRVPYDDNFDLAREARDFRKDHEFDRGNVAVFEYLDENGATQTITNSNLEGEVHSEIRIAERLRQLGIDPSRVTRIYSELSPCENSCQPFINANFPDAEVYYSYIYEIPAERWALRQQAYDLVHGGQ